MYKTNNICDNRRLMTDSSFSVELSMMDARNAHSFIAFRKSEILTNCQAQTQTQSQISSYDYDGQWTDEKKTTKKGLSDAALAP